MKTIATINKNFCCGCTACKTICPTKAINMREDKKGFLYPEVNTSICISCSLCLNTCYENTSEYRALPVLKSYAVKNKNPKVLKQSSSGGVSHALCHFVIEHGGVVYGVGYDEQFRVVTSRAQTIEDCDRFYGSKYVQTNLMNTFQEVFEDIQCGKTVLYFATSCHVGGLLSFLKVKQCNIANLITVDFTCHGTPSPKLFSDYIDFLKMDSSFSCFEFRTKEKPWGYGSVNFGCTISYENGRKEVDTNKARIFLNLFFSNNFLRPNCFQCRYSSPNKPADLTIMDFWGLKDELPNLFDECGVSAVFTHTNKGQKLLKSAPELEIWDCTVEQITKKQANLKKSPIKPPSYYKAWEIYETHGFRAVSYQWGNYSVYKRIKRLFKKLLNKPILNNIFALGNKFTL